MDFPDLSVLYFAVQATALLFFYSFFYEIQEEGDG